MTRGTKVTPHTEERLVITRPFIECVFFNYFTLILILGVKIANGQSRYIYEDDTDGYTTVICISILLFTSWPRFLYHIHLRSTMVGPFRGVERGVYNYSNLLNNLCTDTYFETVGKPKNSVFLLWSGCLLCFWSYSL